MRGPLLRMCEVPCHLEKWLTVPGVPSGCEGCEWSRDLNHEMSVELGGGSQSCAEWGLEGEHSWDSAWFQGQLEGGGQRSFVTTSDMVLADVAKSPYTKMQPHPGNPHLSLRTGKVQTAHPSLGTSPRAEGLGPVTSVKKPSLREELCWPLPGPVFPGCRGAGACLDLSPYFPRLNKCTALKRKQLDLKRENKPSSPAFATGWYFCITAGWSGNEGVSMVTNYSSRLVKNDGNILCVKLCQGQAGRHRLRCCFFNFLGRCFSKY